MDVVPRARALWSARTLVAAQNTRNIVCSFKQMSNVELAAELRTIITLLESFVTRLERSPTPGLSNLSTSLSNSLSSALPPSTENEDCAICMAPLEDNAVPLECGHRFHHACISRWLQSSTTCPVCRSEVVSRANAGVRSTYDRDIRRPRQYDGGHSLFEDGGGHENVNFSSLFQQTGYFPR